MEEAIRFAKKYLEDLLSFFGLNVDVHATHEDDIIELNIPSTHMNGFLIGQRGDTVRALQYMVSSALKNNNHEYSRVNVDVADYKKAQNDRLAEQVEYWITNVKADGKDMELKPMNPAFRRVVHQVAGEHGLSTESIGEGYDRRVVIKAPAPDAEEPEAIDNEVPRTEKAKPSKKPKASEKSIAKKSTPKPSKKPIKK